MRQNRRKIEDYTVECLYDNWHVYSPNNVLIFLSNKEKAEWYLYRNLAVKISDDPPSIRLTFQPKKLGCLGDAYSLCPKDNQCCVCGKAKELTRHHVIPYAYRTLILRKMSLFSSSSEYRRDFHDVIALCNTCHNKCEAVYHDLKLELAQKYNAPLAGIPTPTTNYRTILVRGYAKTILKNSQNVPEPYLSKILKELNDYFGHEPSAKELKDTRKLNVIEYAPNYKTHYELMVEQLLTEKDIFEFVVLWRKYFMEQMKPKHMPIFWNVHRTLKGNKFE